MKAFGLDGCAAPGGLRRLLFGIVAALASCGGVPLDAVSIDPRSLTTDLVAHWTFDEGSGSVVGDSSGNGHVGELTGGTWTPAGRFAGALELTTDEFVAVKNFPQATASWTVSVWAKTSAAQLAVDQTDGATILSTENVFAGGWQLHLDNRPGFQRYDAAYWVGPNSSDYIVVTCDCIEMDRWVHITAVFDGQAKQFTLYRDGVPSDRTSLPAPILPGDSTLYMGTWNMMNRFLTGVIDDFAIWSRALSPDEIALLSRQPVGD
jgi:hypothetical protein